MAPPPDEEYLAPGVVEAVLAKPWPVIAAAIVGAVLAFAASTFLISEQYSVTATVTIADPDQATFGTTGRFAAEYERYLTSTAGFARSSTVMSAAAEELGMGRVELEGAVSVRADVNDRALKVGATGPTGRVAADRANTVAAVFDTIHAEHLAARADAEIEVLDEQIAPAEEQAADARQSLAANPDDVAALSTLEDANAVIRSLRERRVEIRVNATSYGSGVELIDEASVPGAPSSPNTRLNLAVGLLIGTLAGMAFVWFRTDRTRPLHSSDEPRSLIGVPRLGKIPKVKAPSTLLTDSRRMPSADYQFVASALRATLSESGSVVLVGGVGPEAGTTVTAANLAVAAARDDLTVALVDGCPDEGLAQLFEQPTMQPGLLDLVTRGDGEVDRQRLTWALGPVSVDGRSVRFLAYGTDDRTAAANEFRSHSTRAIVEELRSRFDIVFIDCGSVLTSPTAGALAPAADAMVLVIRNGTQSDAVVEARERLAVERVPVAGYVYTHADPAERRRFRATNLGVARPKIDQATDDADGWPGHQRLPVPPRRELPSADDGTAADPRSSAESPPVEPSPSEDPSSEKPSSQDPSSENPPESARRVVDRFLSDEPPREEPPVEEDEIEEWLSVDDARPGEDDRTAAGETTPPEPPRPPSTETETARPEHPDDARDAGQASGDSPDTASVSDERAAGSGAAEPQPSDGAERSNVDHEPGRNGTNRTYRRRRPANEFNRPGTWSLPPSVPLTVSANREST